jgi:hypothetical protein
MYIVDAASNSVFGPFAKEDYLIVNGLPDNEEDSEYWNVMVEVYSPPEKGKRSECKLSFVAKACFHVYQEFDFSDPSFVGLTHKEPIFEKKRFGVKVIEK